MAATRLGQVYSFSCWSSSAGTVGCNTNVSVRLYQRVSVRLYQTVSIRLYQTGSQKRVTSVIMGSLISNRSKCRDLESGSAVLCHQHQHHGDPDFGSGSRHEERHEGRCACIQHSTSSSTRFPFNSHLVAPSFTTQNLTHSLYGHDHSSATTKHRRSTKTDPDSHSHYHCCGVRSVPLTILERQSSPFSNLGSQQHFDGGFIRKQSKAGIFSDQKRFYSSSMDNGQKRGWDVLWQSLANKDLAFTLAEREKLGLKGLLPPAVRSQSLQADAIMANLRHFKEGINKYMYLRDLQDWNKKLFYRILCDHTEEVMPIVYTPIVGEACQKYSMLFKRPRGMFITIHDAGNVPAILANWPENDIKAIVVTDGERILGLGDLGANGMGIPVGKLALYSALSGIDPSLTLPVTIDVGTNNQSLLNDPFYIGLKQKRVTGAQYDDLIQEFMEAAVQRWGRSCLIQFEDFGNSNAFRLLEKYQRNYCTFNDDIQGTASVTVAGIIASCKITGLKVSQQTFLFLGAGEAALGTADLLVTAMLQEGLSEQEARDRVWLYDSKGVICVDRPTGGLDPHKEKYAKNVTLTKDFEELVRMSNAGAIIGVSAQPGLFTEGVVKQMAAQNKRPLIFPLSNPTSRAECTAEQAFKWSEGRCIFASGSPFDVVEYEGKKFVPGQGNNAYIFPGIAMATIFCGCHHIPNEAFLVAAKALADQVSQDNLDEGRLFPPLSNIREVSLKIAAKCAQYFYNEGIATVRPEPDDKLRFMQSKQYDFNYDGSGIEKTYFSSAGKK